MCGGACVELLGWPATIRVSALRVTITGTARSRNWGRGGLLVVDGWTGSAGVSCAQAESSSMSAAKSTRGSGPGREGRDSPGARSHRSGQCRLTAGGCAPGHAGRGDDLPLVRPADTPIPQGHRLPVTSVARRAAVRLGSASDQRDREGRAERVDMRGTKGPPPSQVAGVAIFMDGGPGVVRVRACGMLVSSCGSLPRR